MLSDMLGASSVLVVVEIIIDGVGTAPLGNKPNVIRHMNLLCEVLDIEATVNHLSVVFTLFIESNQERSCQSVH